MLGKRPRALQRTTSSSHIGMDSSSVQNKDKLRPPALTVPAPCQRIVGYYNMPKELDGEKKHSPSPDSISPLSGLQCLLTDVVRKKELGETAYKSVGLSIVIESCNCRGTGGSQPVLGLRSPGGLEAPLVSSSRQSKPQIVSKSMLPPQCRDSGNGYKCFTSPAGAVSPGPAVYNNVLPAPLPAIDFLDACYLCNRRLGPGRDIYMYRGDRAFCSVECRWKQILTDEHREKCASAALKPVSAKPSRHAGAHRNRVEGRGLTTAA